MMLIWMRPALPNRPHSLQHDVHLLLYTLQVLISYAVRLIGAAVDDVPDLVLVLLIVVAPLPDGIEDLVHLLHQELLAGYAAHLGVPAHGADIASFLRIECLMVCIDGADIRIARDLHGDPVGIRDGIADLLVEHFLAVGEIDGVAEALAHLGVSIEAWKPGDG